MSFERGRESLETPATPGSVKTTGNDVGEPVPKIHTDVPVEPSSTETRARLDKVLQSDIGISTLLTRLKQSISSTKEFSTFIKERAVLEEKHAQGLKKVVRNTFELIRRPDNRQGSYAHNYEEVVRIQDRMGDNGIEFAQTLYAMADELQDLAANSERGRKHWKHTGLDAEQRSQDAESAMEKAKSRYYSLAEQYDRARTGERQSGKFGLKGPKSAAQQEEALLSKVQNADLEYSDRVQTARSHRQELVTSSRPQAVRELQHLIMECDAALGMQLAKFAFMNERLLLKNGLMVKPIKEQGGPTGASSLIELAQNINNQRDYDDFVLGHASHVGQTPTEIKYEKHPALLSLAHPVPSTTQSFSPTTGNVASSPSERRETRSESFIGSSPHTGQTTGVISSQAINQSGSYAPAPGPPSPPPQLPQIGALSLGGRNSLDSSRPNESISGRAEPGYGSTTGQHRPGQMSYSGPASSPYGGVASQQRDIYAPGSVRGQTGPHNDVYSGGPNMGSNSQQHDVYNPTSGRGQIGQQHNIYAPGPGRGAPGQQHDPYAPGPGRGQPLGGAPAYGVGRSVPGQSAVPPVPGQYSQSPTAAGRSMPAQTTYASNERDSPYSRQHGHLSDVNSPLQQSPYSPHQQESRGAEFQNGSYRPQGNHSTTNDGGLGASPTGNNRGPVGRPNLPPALRPVFGVSLDDLFRRDSAAVPAVVYQCIQAVDKFGLNTEGIYRTSGSAQHITELRALFDHDSSRVDLSDPAAFFNDIAAVTTLLKQFLRDLKDPLLTSAQYNAFIQAAKIHDDIVRRDSLHAIINSLPDPNYATLRTIILHLDRVSKYSAQNRMTASNLAIVFGPTLMTGQTPTTTTDVGDAGYQARVIETILDNTYQIFDDDE